MPVRLTPLAVKHLCYTWQWHLNASDLSFMSSVLAASLQLAAKHDQSTIGPAVDRMVHREMDSREKQFGVGYFEERRELLLTTLSLLERKGTPIDHVVRILRDARRAKRTHAAKIAGLYADRERIRQLRIVRGTIAALDRLVRDDSDDESDLDRVAREMGLKIRKEISQELAESRAAAARLKQSLVAHVLDIKAKVAALPPSAQVDDIRAALEALVAALSATGHTFPRGNA